MSQLVPFQGNSLPSMKEFATAYAFGRLQKPDNTEENIGATVVYDLAAGVSSRLAETDAVNVETMARTAQILKELGADPAVINAYIGTAVANQQVTASIGTAMVDRLKRMK